MGDVANGWNLTDAEWARLVERARVHADVLEDGAYVRTADSPNGGIELQFYASALSRPPAWHYPFSQTVPETHEPVSYIGHAWHHAPTGFVEFEIQITAAAQALLADYVGGADNYDEVAFEQAVEAAVKGTPADLDWLKNEFARLVQFSA